MADSTSDQSAQVAETVPPSRDTKQPIPPWARKVLGAGAGLFLTALFLPAFTRQWDDREKANDVKAAIIAQIATASAKTLSSSDDLLASSLKKPTTASVEGLLRPPPPAETDWSRQSLLIQAKLAGYFGPGVVADWSAYRDLVDVSAGIAAGYYGTGIPGYEIPPPSPTLHAIQQFADLRASTLAQLMRFHSKKLTPARRANLAGELYTRISDVQNGLESIQGDLLTLQAKIDAEILRSHTRGYSTTWGDLFRSVV